MQKYHFISGLPRSGSTLLSAILKQNPRFCSDISDPLHDYARNLLQVTHSAVGMEVAVPVEKRAKLIKGLFANFYEDKPEVCFNTNRAWTAQTAMIRDLFPYSKIIICIRDVPWILDSFEQLNSKNPYSIKALYNHQDMSNVYMRSNSLMSMEGGGGYVTGPLTCLKQALFSNEKDMLCVVDYEALTKYPKETMQKIYQFIGEPWFEHDFNNVEDSYDEFDEAANITGLHTVRKKVEFKIRKPILPSDLWQNYTKDSFWKYDFDHIKKQILWIG
jgi:sulfotransferase